MKCRSCRADFCWACMKLGTKCGAYNCHNGAPYGNAKVIGEPRRFPGDRRRLSHALKYLCVLDLCFAGLELMFHQPLLFTLLRTLYFVGKVAYVMGLIALILVAPLAGLLAIWGICADD